MAVEGPIGVGKTTLAKMLASVFNAKEELEEANNNPFITKFYENIKSYAFQTQVYFLLTRYKHQQNLLQMDLFSKMVIGDYIFEKDRIFAYANLTDDELLLYEKLYSMLKMNVPKPDLVIFLQADTPILLERIRKRKREFENKITEEYLDRLNKAYNNFFFHYNSSPLLVVNTNGIDFVDNIADFENLVREIKEMKFGTRYYVPRK